MAVQCVWASIDERGKATGGTAGDQTGKEVIQGSYYQFGQTYVLRPVSSTIGIKMADAAIKTAKNNKIGYDQSQRTTFYTQASKVGWDPSKITVACETDCSAAVAVWAAAAGISISKDVYSGNLRAALLRTGKFTSYTGTGWTNTDKNLKRGDVIIAPGKHVIIVVTDSPSVGNTASSSAKKSIEIIANEVIAGKWGTGSTRKSKLEAAGYNYTQVQNKVNEILKSNKTSTATYTTKTVIAKAGLNVRKGPGTGYAKIRTLTYGSKIKCYSSKNGWWKINSTAEEWVYGAYIK